MIIDIFIPEKIGSYYLLPKRVIGFDVTKSHVYASQLYLSGEKIILEKFYQEMIDPDATRPYTDRVSEAIRAIMTEAPPCDEIRTSLSSTIVVFKELVLPFLESEKISMLLYYEIEQHLPFSIQDTIADFIITKQNIQDGTSTIMVAAAQKEYVAQQLVYFDLAGYNPCAISVDLFDLYALYRKIPAYAQLQETVVLIDIEFNATRLAFIVNEQLKLIRTLPRGIAHVAKTIAQKRSIQNGQAIEDIIRFGLEKHDDTEYKTVAHDAMKLLLKDIRFTLQAFTNQSSFEYTIDKILLFGTGSEITGIEKFVKQELNIDCAIFDSNALLKVPHVSIRPTARIPRANIMSLSTAFPSAITERFTMRQQEFEMPTAGLFFKQFFTAISLLFIVLFLLIGHNYWQTRSLAQTAQKMERTVVSKLNQLGLTEEKQFDRSIDDARDKVSKEEELWFAFSRQTRFSFLKALQDLSTAIDRKAIGLNLKKMIITTNEITLEGEVKGFEELKILERELRESKLFIFVPTLQELKFSEKLPLRKNGEVPR